MAACPSPTTCSSLATRAPRSASTVRRTSPGLSSTSRIWMSVSAMSGGLRAARLRVGHSEVDGASGPGGGVEPDTPVQTADDLLAQREPDARSGVLGAGVQPLEHEKDPIPVLVGDADAVVLHRELPVGTDS